MSYEAELVQTSWAQLTTTTALMGSWDVSGIYRFVKLDRSGLDHV